MRRSDIGQHVTLFPDGIFLSGRSFSRDPASIKYWNEGAFSVEMLGNFDKGKDKLKGKQFDGIIELISYFIEAYGEGSIKFHREGPGVVKSCPRTSIDKSELILQAKELSKEIRVFVNDKLLKSEAVLLNGKTMVHIRVLEDLGYRVDWEDRKIQIQKKL